MGDAGKSWSINNPEVSSLNDGLGLISVPTIRTGTSQETLTFAYLYGWHIYAYALYVRAMPNSEVNMPYPYRKLSTPEDHAVVRPNVDTLLPLCFMTYLKRI